MDGGLDDGWDWDDDFLDEIIRKADEALASRNSNPTPIPTRTPTLLSSAGAHPAPATPSAVRRVQRCGRNGYRRVLPSARALPAPGSRGDARLSQRPAPEESDATSGPAGSRVGAKRERETRELERLKRELSRVSKQMNELKNKWAELRKDRKKKELQIKAKEVEISNLKKANVSFASKDVCRAGIDIDQSSHAPANGALQSGGSSWASNKTNGKDNNASSLQVDLDLKQGHQTDLP